MKTIGPFTFAVPPQEREVDKETTFFVLKHQFIPVFVGSCAYRYGSRPADPVHPTNMESSFWPGMPTQLKPVHPHACGEYRCAESPIGSEHKVSKC